MGNIANLKTGTRPLEILHPGKHTPLGVRLHLVHIDDDSLKAIKRAVTDENQRLQAKGKFFKADDVEDNTLRLVSAAIKSWEWYNPTGSKGDAGYDETEMPDFEGETNPECNRKNISAICKTLPWFKDQVTEAIGDIEGFFAN